MKITPLFALLFVQCVVAGIVGTGIVGNRDGPTLQPRQFCKFA